MSIKRTIVDFFGKDVIKNSELNGRENSVKNNCFKIKSKRTKLDIEEVVVVKEVTKCADNIAPEVAAMSSDSNAKVFESPKQALKQVFGFNGFRGSLQENAVKCVIKGEKDVFISMPTGAGKSLCYQLPAVFDSNKLTIVVSPLIALITNQISALKKLLINAESINSHLNPNEQKRIKTELMSENCGIKLLYITPEMAAQPGFALIVEHLYKTNQLSRIAIDEAHCVSQWGHDFRPDYLKLGRLKKRYLKVPWIALTATASEKVVTDIISLLNLREPVSKFTSSNFRPNLYYDIVFKDALKTPIDDLKDFIAAEVGLEDLPSPKSDPFSSAKNFVEKPDNKTHVGIVYCRTRNVCEDIAMALSKYGIKAMAYHAGMSAHQRKSCQEKWMSGVIKVMTATVSFGMGVDKANVRFVIHWNVPQSLTGYYQESGRAGRDGAKAKCRIYYSVQDRNAISYLIKQESEKKLSKNNSQQSNDEARQVMKRFEKMIQYCESGLRCRHSVLLSEFIGDDVVIKTGCKTSCDVCVEPKKVQRRIVEFESIQMNKNMKTTKHSDERDDWSLPKEDIQTPYGYREKEEKEVTVIDIVKNEFKRRNKHKDNTYHSNAQQNQGFRKATDVLEPGNRRIKDIDLTLRIQFLNKLKQEIELHYNEVNVFDKSIQLNANHFTEMAAKFELNNYKTKGNKMMYRAGICEYIRELKKASNSCGIHESIKQYNSSQESVIEISQTSN